MAAADTLKTGSKQVAAGAAAGITQLAQAAPDMAKTLVEGTLKPVAADVAEGLPGFVEEVGGQLLQDEGERRGLLKRCWEVRVEGGC